MLQRYEFILPIPLSVNAIYKLAGKPYPHIYLTTPAKKFKEQLILLIQSQAKQQGMPHYKDTTLILELTTFNLRKNSDTDNLYKLLQDSFQASGYVDNDKCFLNRTMQRVIIQDKDKYILVSIFPAIGEFEPKDAKRYFFW